MEFIKLNIKEEEEDVKWIPHLTTHKRLLKKVQSVARTPQHVHKNEKNYRYCFVNKKKKLPNTNTYRSWFLLGAGLKTR